MNGTTLKALRLALGFTQQESANMIGAVSMRTWRYWEDEDRAIPADVAVTIRELGRFKQTLIREACAQIKQITETIGEPGQIAVTYYASLDAWMTQESAAPIQWKPHCMAMSALAEQFQMVTLIAFNAVEYQIWLGEKHDNHAMRAQWAAYSSSTSSSSS